MKIKRYAQPTALLVLLLITVPTASFYGGAFIGVTYIPKPMRIHIPEGILGVNEGLFKRACKDTGIILDPKVTPPSNFPGYTKSSLLAFNGEIVHIVDDAWRISNGNSSKEFIIDSTVVLDKAAAANYKVGDCVTLFYGLKRGFKEKLYSVSTQ
jgi:hypothetical protein